MNILALNFGHDAAVAVLRDQEVVNCLLRERHTRVKHHIGLTADLVVIGLDRETADRLREYLVEQIRKRDAETGQNVEAETSQGSDD